MQLIHVTTAIEAASLALAPAKYFLRLVFAAVFLVKVCDERSGTYPLLKITTIIQATCTSVLLL